ncbi:unnamed protein product, partial [Polarella glacialis]
GPVRRAPRAHGSALVAAAVLLTAWHFAGQALLLTASPNDKAHPLVRRAAEADWREVRAALVAGSSSPAHEGGRGGWAHLVPVVEVGALLLATAGAFALTRPELHRAVALVLQHSDHETDDVRSVAVLLNRRDPSGSRPGYG